MPGLWLTQLTRTRGTRNAAWAGTGQTTTAGTNVREQSRPGRTLGDVDEVSNRPGADTDKPLLILDVDGVVLPYLPNLYRGPAPPGFRDARAWGFNVWVPEHLPAALQALALRFEVVWCTDWEDAANTEAGELFGLPELPVLRADRAQRGWWKLRAVADYAGERPLAWADDQMSSSARHWASSRNAPTLLLRPRPDCGLSPRQLTLITRFASRVLQKRGVVESDA